MTFRLYAGHDGVFTRVAHQYATFDKAMRKARCIAATLVEIRELTAQGKERLVSILREGTPIAL